MARQKTKEELIQPSQQNFKKLNDFIDSFSEKKLLIFRRYYESKHLRRHLHHWHLTMLEWYEVGTLF